jgi:hypothetical protein
VCDCRVPRQRCCFESDEKVTSCTAHTSRTLLINLTSQGEEEEAIGFDGEAVVKYVLGRQYERAANIAISSMKKQVSHRVTVNRM